MEDETPMTFETIEHERDYWREKYQEVSDTWEDAKVEVGKPPRKCSRPWSRPVELIKMMCGNVCVIEMIQLQSEDQEQHVAALGDEIDALGKQVADVRFERDELRRKFGEEMRALNESIAGMQVSLTIRSSGCSSADVDCAVLALYRQPDLGAG